VFRGDLLAPEGLPAALDGVDLVVHLAAAVIAPDAVHYQQTLGGTERLVQAMAGGPVRRILLVGSMSVYDWQATRRVLDESSPLEVRPYPRGAYAAAKLWQERILQRAAGRHGWQLTIVRPGVIWGPGNEALFMAGWLGGRVHVVLGPRRRLPLTYIDNCAAALVAAAENPEPPPVLNIVDDDSITAWRYLGEHLRRRGLPGVRAPLPFRVLWLAAALAKWTSRLLFGPDGKLPSMLIPCRLAVFKPLRFSNRLARERLGWRPEVPLEEALRRTFEPES
jgi:UDP-glucose 4-epimerase